MYVTRAKHETHGHLQEHRVATITGIIVGDEEETLPLSSRIEGNGMEKCPKHGQAIGHLGRLEGNGRRIVAYLYRDGHEEELWVEAELECSGLCLTLSTQTLADTASGICPQGQLTRSQVTTRFSRDFMWTGGTGVAPKGRFIERSTTAFPHRGSRTTLFIG